MTISIAIPISIKALLIITFGSDLQSHTRFLYHLPLEESDHLDLCPVRGYRYFCMKSLLAVLLSLLLVGFARVDCGCCGSSDLLSPTTAGACCGDKEADSTEDCCPVPACAMAECGSGFGLAPETIAQPDYRSLQVPLPASPTMVVCPPAENRPPSVRAPPSDNHPEATPPLTILYCVHRR